MGKSKRMGRPPDAARARSVLVAFRVMPSERASYQRAADAQEMQLSDWIRGACNDASNRQLQGRSKP